jgi:transposase
LQLEAGWKITKCRFEGEPRRLLLKLDFEQGKRFGFPQCGKLCPTRDTSVKRWRHLNFFQYECLLEARTPGSNCPEHRSERGGALGAGRWRFYPSFRGLGSALVRGNADGGGG